MKQCELCGQTRQMIDIKMLLYPLFSLCLLHRRNQDWPARKTVPAFKRAKSACRRIRSYDVCRLVQLGIRTGPPNTSRIDILDLECKKKIKMFSLCSNFCWIFYLYACINTLDILYFEPHFYPKMCSYLHVILKGTGTRDLIWLKVVSLERSWWVGLTEDL